MSRVTHEPIRFYHLNSGRSMLFRALTNTGRLDELRQRYGPALRDAVQLGNRYMVLNVKCSAAFFVALADGRPAEAQRFLDEAKAELPTDGFLVQHYWHLNAEAQVGLYRGRAREVHAMLVTDSTYCAAES